MYMLAQKYLKNFPLREMSVPSSPFHKQVHINLTWDLKIQGLY